MAPLNTPLTKAQYDEALRDLVFAMVQRYGEMTVLCLRDRVNQEIVQNGIIGAAERVRNTQ